MMIGTPAAHANFIPPPQYFGQMDFTSRGIPSTAKACTSRRRDCRSAAPPSPSIRCFNMDGEGMSVK